MSGGCVSYLSIKGLLYSVDFAGVREDTFLRLLDLPPGSRQKSASALVFLELGAYNSTKLNHVKNSAHLARQGFRLLAVLRFFVIC